MGHRELTTAACGYKLLHYSVAGLQCFIESLCLIAAAFGHVSFAATAATNYRSQFLDDLPGRDFSGKVRRRAHNQRHFSFATTAEDYDA